MFLKGGVAFMPYITYPFMYKSMLIGFFNVYFENSREYDFEVELIETTNVPWAFKGRDGEFISKYINKYLHRKIIRNWLEERVFDPNRHDCDEILVRIGLEKYDILDILKHTCARTRYDEYWIKFHDKAEYEESVLSQKRRKKRLD
jgi:hypothetical protein